VCVDYDEQSERNEYSDRSTDMRTPYRSITTGWVKVALAVGAALWADAAWARDDWQLWHEETVRVLERGGYQLSLYQASRFRDNLSEPYFVQGKLVNAYRLHRLCAVAAGYSYIQQKGADNHWREEHRWDVEATPKATLGPLTFENRMRMELRTIEGSVGEEEWRYRNRLQASAPLPWLDGRLTLFANEELFYATPPDAWNQNRVFIGLRAKLATAVSGSLAWGVQSLRRGNDWEDRQVASLALRLAF